MKFVLIFALALGMTLARAPVEEWRYWDTVLPQRGIEDSAFRQGREYKFIYDGQVTTGIPGSSNQHSGNRIQALVTLAFSTGNTVLMRMERIRMGKMNRHVPHPQKMMPFDSFEDTMLDSKLKEVLEATVKFTYTGGMVKDVFFDGKEHSWTANVKRGVLNLIQVNLQKQKMLTSEERVLNNDFRADDNTDDSTFYRVMEESVEGECETLYTVTRQPHPKYQNQVLNVTKSINFERCQKRPHIKYNFRFADNCPTCESKYNEDEKFLKSSTVAKFNISGTKENFLIESARVESQYVFVPFNEESNVITTYVNQTLVLIKTGPISNQIQEPRDPIESDSDMIYTLDWEVERERMLMEGQMDSFRKLPFHEVNKVELVQNQMQKLVQKIGEQIEDGATRAYSHLIQALRMCSKQELERLSDMFFQQQQQWSPEESKKAKDILPQALAVCGSKHCVSQLLKHIRQNDIHEVKASLAIKSLINIRTVSKEIIQELINFAETEPCSTQRKCPMLRRSLWLTIGSLMNALCSPNEDVLAREYKENSEQMCPRNLKQQYVEILFRKGHESNRWDDNVLFMKTVSNAGLDLSVFELEKIITNRDKHYPSYLRQQAIVALRQLRDIMPKKIQKILMPIVLNKLENPTVRIVAVHMVLQSLPSRPILDQLAKLTHHDNSLQLTSFLRSYMDSIANTTNPCEKKLATDMRLSLRQAKSIETGLSHSKKFHLPLHSKKHSLGVDLDFATVLSNTSYIPRHLTANMNLNFLGFWHKQLIQLTASSEGLENLFEKLFQEQDSYLYDVDGEEFNRRHPRNLNNQFSQELKSIFETLKIKSRQQPEEFSKEPKAWLSMKLKEQEIAFQPFHKETVQQWLNENRQSRQEWETKLRNGLPINMHGASLLHEMSYKIPTTVGFPLEISVRVPLVFKLTGKIQATYESFSKASIKAELKPSMMISLQTTVKCITPSVDTGVKVIVNAKAFTPIDAKIETDFRNNEIDDVKIQIKPPTTKRDLLVLESRPITYTRQWEKTVNQWPERQEVTIFGEELNRATTFQKCGGQKSLGLEFCVRGHYHKTPQKSITGTPFAPMTGPNKLVITCEPGQDVAEQVTLKFNAQMTPSESFRSTFKSSEFSRERKSSEQDSNERSGESEYKNYEVKKAIKTALKFEAEARNRRLTVEMTHHYDQADRLSKLSAKIQRSPLPDQPEQWMGCLNAEVMKPTRPQKINEIDDKEIVANAKFSWGRSCEGENQINLKLKGEQSKEQIDQYIRDPEYQMYEKCEDRSLCSPISQDEYLRQISQLLKYTVDLEYKNVPVSVKNITNKVFLMLKNHYFWQSDIAQILVRNPEDKIKAVIRIDPQSLQRVNITIKTPTENTTLKDLPLPMKIGGYNVKSNGQWWGLGENTVTDMCHVSSNKIETFDNVEYKVPLTTCFAVLAKDCSPEPSFAVLMRKQRDGSELKEVKIVTPEQRIMLRPQSESDDRITVEINGEQYNPEESREHVQHGHVVARVEKEGRYVKIVLPDTGVKVYFDGYACNVKLSKMYQNQQCGLCGHYDEEFSDEFRTADYKSTNDVREFYKSYIVQDQQCSMPSDDKICDDEQCDYEPAWESNDKIESEDERLTSEQPIYRTKIVERGDELCFSTVPLPQCASHSYSEKYASEKTVNFVCFDRDDRQAEQYERQVRNNGEVLMEFNGPSFNPAFSRVEKIVEKCSSYY
jgi:hypothetical protein